MFYYDYQAFILDIILYEITHYIVHIIKVEGTKETTPLLIQIFWLFLPLSWMRDHDLPFPPTGPAS